MMRFFKMQMVVVLALTVIQANFVVFAQTDSGRSGVVGDWELVSAEMKEYKAEEPTILYRQQTAGVGEVQQNITSWPQVLVLLSFKGADISGDFEGRFSDGGIVDRIYRLENHHLQLFFRKEIAVEDCTDCPENLMLAEGYPCDLTGNTLILQQEYATNSESTNILRKVVYTYRKK